MLKRLGLALAALVLLTGVPVTPAAAVGEPDTGAFNAFNLKGSNGYRIVVWAISGKGYRNGQVLILAGHRRQGAIYLAPAKVTDRSVAADLGSLGKIAVTFQPSGEKGVVHPVCDPSQKGSYDKGSYVGEIEFHGEEGYTDVSTSRAAYSLHPYIDIICPGSSSGEYVGRFEPGARLRLKLRRGDERISMQVNQNRPGARVRIRASLEERRGRIRISRELNLTHPASAFDFAPDLRAASLSPAEPFSGRGLFLRGAKPANRWTGGLALDFPGRSNVPLTGPRFRAKLVRARLTEEPAPRNHPNRVVLASRPDEDLEAWEEAGAEYAASLPPKRK